MKSEAILLSLEWRFSRGRFLTPKLFGFDKIEVPDGFGGKKKILSINESEARVVKWMYATLLNGGSPEEIAEVLTEMAIPTGGRRRDGTLNTHWTSNGVIATLRNEKHCGDVLARKTYTPNYKDHKSKKNNGKKNKYFQPDHHDAIVSRSTWNAAQRILNSRKYGHEGSYLPLRIIDHGALSGYISMNRAWAGFDFEDYYRAGQIAMGMIDEDLETDLETEYLPEGGHRIGGLMDDNGIAQIARDLTAAEQEIKDELEGRSVEASENKDREEASKSFQVVSGDMFSRVRDPVIRITTKGITFNACCVSRLPGASYVELLFNPVERMLIVRPCKETHPNAIPWDAKYKSAAPLTKVIYDSMGWKADYSFRVPCQTITNPDRSNAGSAVLIKALELLRQLFADLAPSILKRGKRDAQNVGGLAFRMIGLQLTDQTTIWIKGIELFIKRGQESPVFRNALGEGAVISKCVCQGQILLVCQRGIRADAISGSSVGADPTITVAGPEPTPGADASAGPLHAFTGAFNLRINGLIDFFADRGEGNLAGVFRIADGVVALIVIVFHLCSSFDFFQIRKSCRYPQKQTTAGIQQFLCGIAESWPSCSSADYWLTFICWRSYSRRTADRSLAQALCRHPWYRRRSCRLQAESP